MAVVQEEAERVRLIFSRYLELGSVRALMRDLRDRNIVTKAAAARKPAPPEVAFRSAWSLILSAAQSLLHRRGQLQGPDLAGEQPPIMDRDLFDAVQQKLTDQWTSRSRIRNASDHLLTGLLFDDAGHRMVPTHATKAGIRYRYYVSLPCLHGEARTAKVGSVTRVPATDLEDVLVKSFKEHLKSQSAMPAPAITDRSVLAELIERIDVYKDRLAVRLRLLESPGAIKLADDVEPTDARLLSIP